MLATTTDKEVLGVLLPNGATFYANVSKTPTHIKFDHPIALRQVAGPDGQPVMQPIQFIPTSDEAGEHQIENHHVILTFKPHDEIVSAYQQLTGAILTPPTPKLIVG